MTDIALVLAYPSPSGTAIYLELNKNQTQWSDWRTKNTWTTQTYENVRSYTWLTNPCPKCFVSAKPYDGLGNIFVAVTTTEGQIKDFGNPTNVNSPNDYRLKIWRTDHTLLTTIHSSVWMINA